MQGLKRLEAINKISIKKDSNWIHRKIFLILHNDDIWLKAYENINKSKETNTIFCTSEIAEGFSTKKLKLLKKAVISESYKFSCIKEGNIPKPNGEKKFLTVTTFSDKMVQEVIKIILEAIYEPIFSNVSFGFRDNKGPHNALSHIEKKFRLCSYVIEGDIKEAYTSISHQIFIKLLQKKIEDEKFVNLIRRLLKGGILLDNKIIHSLTDTPQDDTVSTILANIYFHELDLMVNKLIIDNSVTNKPRKDIMCKNISSKISLRSKKILSLGSKKSIEYNYIAKERSVLERTTMNIPNTTTNNIKIHYVRYADDWVIGIQGSLFLSKVILTKVVSFLTNNLKLELSKEKTKITCLHRGIVQFLGYDIFFPRNRPVYKINSVSRQGNSKLRFEPRVDVIIDKLNSRGYARRGKNGIRPISQASYTTLDDHVIVDHFKSVWLGVYNYFSGSTKRKRLQYIQYILHMSCAMTLAHRHQSSCREIFKKHKKHLCIEFNNKGEKKYITFPYKSSWSLKDRRWATNQNMEDPFDIKINRFSKLKLLKDCITCRANLNIKYIMLNI